jgi:hypothetical protein
MSSLSVTTLRYYLQREIRTKIIGVSHLIPRLLATFRSVGHAVREDSPNPTVPSEWLPTQNISHRVRFSAHGSANEKKWRPLAVIGAVM